MKRRKVRIKVDELREAEVQWVSLVDRPANRIPFRVMKRDDALEAGMIDLGNMFSAVKRDVPKASPRVAALVIQKADRERLLPKLAAAGFEVDDVLEQDAVLLVKQDAHLNEEACTAVQLSDSMGVMLTGVKKAFAPFAGASSDFGTNLAAQGFWPSVMVAMDIARDTLVNVLEKAETPAEAQAQIGSVLGEFQSYVLGAVGALPEEAFLAAKVAAETPPAPAGEPAPENEPGEAPAPVQEPAGEEPPPKAAEESIGKAQAPETPTEGEASPAPEPTLQLSNQLTELAGALQSLQGVVDTVAKSQQEFAERLASVEAVAKSAREAVVGTVAAAPAADPPPLNRAIRKAVQDQWKGTSLDKIFSV